MSKDPNYIAKLEKAITQKYGEEAINNPARFWSEDYPLFQMSGRAILETADIYNT